MQVQPSEKIDFSTIPSRAFIHKFTDELIDLIFPIESTFTFRYEVAEETQERLARHLKDILKPLADRLTLSSEEIIEKFFASLPSIYNKLITDAEFFIQSDPAAQGIEEVIIAYPGFYAITVYRLAHELSKLNVPIVPRVISEYAHNKTGIDIHPGAQIGNPFFIDHGTGVVVGQTTIIGNRVKIYQGVTLGALAVRKETKGAKRHPTIEDDVLIYAGSCILGGETTIGHSSVIGGNVWLTSGVPPLSIVYHKSDVHIRDKSEMNEVIDFII
ncbi:MAG: serine O-acetyltransferase [Bacteroidetes bacterium]|nr:serine O-acetyltransferase [Bacteroidota bacterium]